MPAILFQILFAPLIDFVVVRLNMRRGRLVRR
jgi:Na+-transporting NADH:ubiquinone oxidoreductase subunit NqrB